VSGVQAPQREFYKVSEVARIFGVTPQAVYKWIDEEKVKAVRLGNRATRISTAEVDRLKTNGLEPKDEPVAVTTGR
jgi:excisionase family DNA binding protein